MDTDQATSRATIDRLGFRLSVDDADAAIRFYTRALGAKELKRFADGGRIVHAELALGEHVLMVKDADDVDPSPRGLGGSPVIVSLETPDVDEVGRRMLELGAEVVFPIEDQPYGKRGGRLRDPYGHLWMLSEPLSDLEP